MPSLKQRAEELRRQIHHHDYLYYVEAQPEISDREYDKLYAELKKLEEQHPDLVTPDSPTQRPGGQPISELVSVTHRVAMLSIDNSYNAQDLKDWEGRVRKGLKPGEKVRYVVEPKIDGVAISLTYEQGVFTVGVSRGDGTKGDDVTHNLKTVRGVPLRLHTDKPPALFEARGEVYMTKADFATLNEAVKAQGKKPYENPRNLTAGTIRLLDPKLCAERKLRLFAYALGALKGVEVKTHTESLELLKRFGFPTAPGIQAFDRIDEVIAYCQSWDEKRLQLPFETDGMVVKVDDLAQRQRIGTTGKVVKWAIAYKFEAEQAISKILNIEISVGKYGEQTPVANLEPVRLAGTTVSRASLHNAAKLKEKDIRIGDKVVVVKRGEIIPHVEYALHEARTGTEKPYEFPKKCAVCGSPTKLNETGKLYLCTNEDSCPAQFQKRLESFAKRERMDIAGLGRETASLLVDSGLVRGVTDLYKLKKEQLLKLERMGDLSAQNLLDGIEASKSRGLGRLLSALSIPNVGERFGPELAQAIPSMDELLAKSKEDLAKIKGFGPKRAESIHKFFHCPEGKKLVADLKAAGVKLTEDVRAAPAGGLPLAGQTIVATGTLQNYSRSAIEKRITDLGGKPASSVSKNTTFVIVGADAGSKLAKAKELGIKMMTEDEFEQLVKRLQAALPPAPPAAAAPALPQLLAGKTLVVTGTLAKYGRSEIEELIRKMGGLATGSVSKNTHYVVAGEKAGSKLAKAKELGIPVLSEEEFDKLIGKSGSAAPAPAAKGKQGGKYVAQELFSE
ncbi:MAG: NAD-dependent DNA ligase LigA [Gemmataceae bacterium]|nr:NAD-dependent DNA ligase LigA [Gemmataceae bacterium]